MKKKETRDSNFEVLRILAMILIIMHHINGHILFFQMSPGIYPYNMYFNNPLFYKKLCLLACINTFGKIGDILFILISGYYLTSKKEIDIKNVIIKLLSQLLFCTLVLLFVSNFYQMFIDNSLHDLQSFFLFNDDWWFIGFYLSIVLIGNFFINKMINNFSKEQFQIYLLVLFSLFSLSFTRNIFAEFSIELAKVVNGLFVYSLGGYIKKYNPLKNIKNIYLSLIIIICYIVVIFSYRSNVISNLNDQYYQSFETYYDWSLIPIVVGVLLFEIFNRINFKSKIINSLSSATLTIYILHDNYFVYNLLRKIEYVKLLHNNYAYFIIILIFTTIALYMIGYIIYLLFKCIYNKILRVLV